MFKKSKYVLSLNKITLKDVPLVGGKNASLGEMKRELSPKGINIPDGFALTTKAYWRFLKANKIDKELEKIFSNYKPGDIKSLQETGKKARKLIKSAEFPKDLKRKIIRAYRRLEKKYGKDVDVAVRSSGVVEDQPKMSFAGQFETFLNVKGQKELLDAIKKCLASTFNDRVISYRNEKKISQLKFALSIGVIKMVRSDLASSGIMFTLDTETGFSNVVLINSIWGVGEMIVKGKITPDEFYVFKPTLKKGFKSIILKNLGRKTRKYIYAKKGGLKEVTVPKEKQLKFSLNEKEIITLANWAVLIEEHYSRKFGRWMPQDIEWAKDGKTKELYIVQSRPETVHAPKKINVYYEYIIKEKKKPILEGIAVGDKIGVGQVRVIPSVKQINQFKKGEILVTKMTDPDWVPVMRQSSAIITDEGGKTCHASIIARELGIPAIVGTGTATKILKTGQTITVDCTQGRRGKIFDGKVDFIIKEYNLKNLPKTKTKIMLNIGAPEIAFKYSFLPVEGVGLAREEFIIAEKIKVHPLALYNFEKIKNKNLKRRIQKITIEHKNKKEYFIKELAEGIAQIASAFYPREVIVRFSDFKTNEYKNLIGGDIFEGEEANPMLGFRGASRYLDEQFQPAFKMECQAIKRVRDIFGLDNVSVMIPFCRTVEEAEKILSLMKKVGLERDKNGLKIYVMCEIPSNVVLAKDFLKFFDGMSIGSNDLTQLVLGLDRDNAKIAYIGNEMNEAVREMIKRVIKTCNENKKYSGICGQAPSDIPEFTEFLIKTGIKSISLNPDAVLKTILIVAKKEKILAKKKIKK